MAKDSGRQPAFVLEKVLEIFVAGEREQGRRFLGNGVRAGDWSQVGLWAIIRAGALLSNVKHLENFDQKDPGPTDIFKDCSGCWIGSGQTHTLITLMYTDIVINMSFVQEMLIKNLLCARYGAMR